MKTIVASLAALFLVSQAQAQLDYATGIGEIKASVPANATFELTVVTKYKGQSSANLPATGCGQTTKVLNGTSNGSKVTFTGLGGVIPVTFAAPMIGDVCGVGGQTWASMEIVDVKYTIVARYNGKIEFLENVKP